MISGLTITYQKIREDPILLNLARYQQQISVEQNDKTTITSVLAIASLCKWSSS